MALTVSDIRQAIRDFARNAGDSSMYSPHQVDVAAQMLCNRFIRITRCISTTDHIALTANSATLPAFPSGFRPDRLIAAFTDGTVGDPTLLPVSYEHVVKQQTIHASTSQPRLIAFNSATTGYVYPTPGAIYNVYLEWSPVFTSWTLGAVDGGTLATTTNLPDDYLYELCLYGGPAALQHNEPEHQFAGAAWQKYLAYEQSMMGKGSGGAKIVNLRRR